MFANEVAALTAPIAMTNDIKLAQQVSQTEQPTTSEPTKRTSPRQRMNEYRETLLTIPKIVDQKPVFISLTLRDEIDIVECNAITASLKSLQSCSHCNQI